METQTIYTDDNISAFAAARESGERLEISEDLFYYFLEVLPPVHMYYDATVRRDPVSDPRGREEVITVKASFGFAEGAELVTAFWKGWGVDRGRYFAQLTREMNPYA